MCLHRELKTAPVTMHSATDTLHKERGKHTKKLIGTGERQWNKTEGETEMKLGYWEADSKQRYSTCSEKEKGTKMKIKGTHEEANM